MKVCSDCGGYDCQSVNGLPCLRATLNAREEAAAEQGKGSCSEDPPRPVRVAVVGAGAWGINHVRTFSRLKGCELVAVCDPSPESRARAGSFAPNAKLTDSFDSIVSDRSVDAVVIATPAIMHAGQAQKALAADKHVLVEKPMALTVSDARDIAGVAERRARVLGVGHLMLYHPAFKQLCKVVDSGALGDLHYLYSQRVNLGQFRRDENAMWSLAPHDISMILALTGALPVEVSAQGGAYLRTGIEDVVFMHLRFATGVVAHIHISWLDPHKERRLTVVGSKKMVEFDDTLAVEKLKVYDKGYTKPANFTEYGEFLSLRNGDIHIPYVAGGEPLELQCRAFIDAIRDSRTVKTSLPADGISGLHVVRVLDACQRSLTAGGIQVQL